MAEVMVPEIDVRALEAARLEGGFVLDVRERQEYAFGHVPGAVLMPMGQVLARLAATDARLRPQSTK